MSREDDVTAWLQGELCDAEAASFERALFTDPTLRMRVDEERRVLAALAELDDADWNDTRRGRPSAVWRRVAGIAAAMLVVVLVLGDVFTAPEASVTPPARSLVVVESDDADEVARLLRRPDVAALGAREVGLRAFGLIALMRSGRADIDDDVRAASDWLLLHQGGDGTIGITPGDSDHAVATVALLEASQRIDIAPDAIAAAVESLRDGARGLDGPGATPVQAAWTLQALLMARAAGQADCELAIERTHGLLRMRMPQRVGRVPDLAEARRLCLPQRSSGIGSEALLDASQRVLATLSL